MTPDALRSLPKIELHNHLDGGLRAATILELADSIGYRDLPATDAASLAAWFYQGESGSLERYLEAFAYTLAVMQAAPAVERVAYEAVVDLAADGVIYAEIRFAPVLCTRAGSSREDVLEAALAGLARGSAETGVTVNLIVDAMRNLPDSLVEAQAAARFAGRGVVGFDLAGPEAGFPASAHAEACRFAANAGLHITIHAGEADGPASVIDALDGCGAERIGHGIRVIDDMDGRGGSPGVVATTVLERRIPLEVCPTSNLHTLRIDPAEHPVGRLYRAGFNVTLNTDNRLMSRVTLTDEFALVIEHHGFGLQDLQDLTLAAAAAAFTSESTRRELVPVIDAAYRNFSSSQPATNPSTSSRSGSL